MRVLSALYSALTLTLVGKKSKSYRSASRSTMNHPLPLVGGYGSTRPA